MEILCLKFNHNCTINEEFDFLGIKGAGGGGEERYPDLKKLKKNVSYKTMVPTHTENFSIRAQLETV